MKRDVKLVVDYPYPPERVWRAITDSRVLAEWLMENDFQPRLGHRFQFKTKPRPGFDGIIDCEVTELDPPRRLAYTWHGGALRTTVTWTLTPTPEGTRLRLEHKGFDGLRGLLISLMLGAGWKKKLRRFMPGLLARLGDALQTPTAP
jgi:uncharacterized protein YndB with AHSA1/START domain